MGTNYSEKVISLYPMSNIIRSCAITLVSRQPLWLTLLRSERPKLHTILAFLSAIELKRTLYCPVVF